MEHHGENPDRGGGEPLPSEDDALVARESGFDEELLQEGGGVPFADALDTRDPAPDAALGTVSGDGAPVSARQTAGGSGVRVDDLRDRGSDFGDGADEPPRGGPVPDADV